MKSLLLLSLFVTSFASADDCISMKQVKQIVNQMEIQVETFSRADLMERVQESAQGFVSAIKGQNEPNCEFENQCRYEGKKKRRGRGEEKEEKRPVGKPAGWPIVG